MPRVRRCHVAGCHNFAFLPNHFCKKHLKYEEQYRERHNKFKYRNRVRTEQSQWKYNHIIRYRNSIKAEQNKFYHSKEWRTLRQVVLNRDLHLCQYCKTLGKLTSGSVVDHILPIERFPEEMRNGKNLITCCRDCHYWKTRWEEQYYGTGQHGKTTNNPPVTDINLIVKGINNVRNEHALNGK